MEQKAKITKFLKPKFTELALQYEIFFFQPKSQILLRRKYCCDKICSI